MAKLRAAATQTSARKRKRAPAATKSPRITNFPNAVKDAEGTKTLEGTKDPENTQLGESAKATETNETPEVTESPRVIEDSKSSKPPENTNALDVTKAAGNTELPEATELPKLIKTCVTTKLSKDEKTSRETKIVYVIKHYETIDEETKAVKVIKRYETIDEPESDSMHADLQVAAPCGFTKDLDFGSGQPEGEGAIPDSSDLSSLDYEGDKSGNDNDEEETLFSDNNGTEVVSSNDNEDAETRLSGEYDDAEAFFSSDKDESEEDIDDDASNEDDIENTFEDDDVDYGTYPKFDVTEALLATAHDYNSADDDERDKANDGKGDENNEDAPVNPVTATQRADKRKAGVKAMGQVRTVGEGEEETLEWLHPYGKEWIPAVYHQDVRPALINAASELGEYRHKLAGSKHDKLDVTAFHPAFRRYGAKREDWPEILFKYLPHKSDLMHLKPDYWYLHDGRVIIDMNNDAMYDYPEMPTTLARNADPWLLLTLMRMNNTISLQDIRGRMIGEQNRARADPMGRNRISMNMQRFRKFACCLTWNAIRAVDVQRDYLDKKLPRRCIRQNSTKSFRTLYGWEVAELDTIDAGKYMNRTRAKERDTSKAKSNAVYEEKALIARTMRKAFDGEHPNGLPNDYDTEDEDYRAQQERLVTMPAPVAKMTEDNEPAEENDDESESEPEITAVKRNGRKRQKAENTKFAYKKLYILPDPHTPLDPTVGKVKYAECYQGHRNYAGFVTTAPNSVVDAQLLYDLLEPTRRHFKLCTEFEPARTEGDECYNCQHRQIQDELLEWHRKQPGLAEEVQVCMLIKILYIDDDNLYWNVPWNMEWFGEAPGRDLLGRSQNDGIFQW